MSVDSSSARTLMARFGKILFAAWETFNVSAAKNRLFQANKDFLAGRKRAERAALSLASCPAPCPGSRPSPHLRAVDDKTRQKGQRHFEKQQSEQEGKTS